MPMTKKDFKAIAGIVRYTYDVECGLQAVEQIGLDLEDYCAAQNPRFNRRKFREACFGEDHAAGVLARYPNRHKTP